MNRENVAAWVERYVEAWNKNEPDVIRALFTEDASYYPEPYSEPWTGHDAIVEGWLEISDEPDEFSFEYDVLAVDGDLGVVRGWTSYHEEETDYSNIWLVRLNDDGRATEFTEFWMEDE